MKKRKKLKKRTKRTLAVAVLSLVLVAVTLWKGHLVVAPDAKLSDGFVTDIGGTWSEPVSQEDGKIQILYTYQASDGISLPNAYLYFRSYGMAFRVLVNGGEVYSHFGLQGGYGHIVSLGEFATGDTVTVEFLLKENENQGRLLYSRFSIGDQIGITNSILTESAYVFAFCLLAALVFAVIIGLTVMFHKALPRSQSVALLSLGIFVLLSGIWVLTDSQLLLLVTRRVPEGALISFLSFLLMPFFMLYFIHKLIDLGSRLFYTLAFLYATVLNLFTVNYFLEFFDRMVPIFLEHFLWLVTVVLVWKRGVHQMRQKKDRKLKLVLLGFLCYCCGNIAMLISYGFDAFSPYTRSYALGMAGFITFLFDAACRSVYEQLERNVHLEVQARLAYLDVMTQVGNRAAFHEQQQSDQTEPGAIAYLMADINNLKTTNDTLGHSMGDQIIIRAATCMKEAVGEWGKCYRLGGDEFAARLAGVTAEQARACMQRFYDLVEQENRDSDLMLSVACGCAWSDDAEKDLNRLLEQADEAMYREKQRIKAGA